MTGAIPLTEREMAEDRIAARPRELLSSSSSTVSSSSVTSVSEQQNTGNLSTSPHAIELLLAARDPLKAEASSTTSMGGLLRCHSTTVSHRALSEALSVDDDSMSDCSEDSVPSSTITASRCRIAIAKQILAEATDIFTPSLPLSVGKLDKLNMCKNTGALGPLLGMLQVSAEVEKVRFCLDTLAFLVLDKANRKTVASLNGTDVILRVLLRLDDSNVRHSAVEALLSLVKHDDADKVQMFSEPSVSTLLTLLSSKQSVAQQLEMISFVKKVAFSSDSKLIEPRLLTGIADVLHPGADQAVLMKALRFFRHASKCPVPEHLPAWHSAVFRLVPLLATQQTSQPQQQSGTAAGPGSNGSVKSGSSGRNSVADEALAVLLNLSEHAAFKNALYASGSLQPLLGLLSSPSKTTRISAACILSQMAETGLSREALCQEGPLITLLRALQASACVEVSIGLLYVLNRLAAYKPSVRSVLRQCGTVPMLLKLLKRTADEDAVLGMVQLLELLGVPSPLAVADSSIKVVHQRAGHGAAPGGTSPSDVTVFVSGMCH